MEQDNNLILLIGRIEGKVDTLVHMQGTTSQRIDNMENRLAKMEQEMAASSASGSSSKVWLSNIISVVAVGISAIAAYVGMK